MKVAAEASQQLIYFVSGMWCSTCAKNIRESVSQIDGVASADVNYASKLLLVRTKAQIADACLDQSIQSKVSRIGFGIKKQSEGWVLNFYESLQKESNRKIPWTQVSLVWFLAMWSSMLAFAGYIGGDLSQNELYLLSLVSSVFGLPAILLGILPYANSGLRALWFSKLLTLDFFIFIGGCSAIGVSLLSLLSHSHVTYADSGSMIIAILLLTKKLENTISTKITSNILFQLHPQKTTLEVCKKNEWKLADVSQIKRGDRVRVYPQDTIPLDGILDSPSAEINNHLTSGEARPVFLKKGDHIFAGAIAQTELEILIASPQGERKIDAWAETALLSESHKSKYTKLFSNIESGLVIFAFCGASSIAATQALRGGDLRQVIESFFVGILIFCPCLFASIIPLMKQIAHLALLKSGLLLSRSEALLDLSQVKNFYFDKTGTLEAVESVYIPFSAEGQSALPYLNALASQSKHVTLRGLKAFGEAKPLKEITELAGKGLIAKDNDGNEIHIGSSDFFKEMGLAVLNPDSGLSFVSVNRKVLGQILRKSIYDVSSLHFLKKLLALVKQSKITVLSGDPMVGAGKSFIGLDERISYHGHLSPEEKADLIQGSSAFIGDGLNDTLALAKARVSFRLGHRIQGFGPVDFHLQAPSLDLILRAIQYSKKYRKILIQTGCAAFVYNTLALTLAALGKFSPLGAVLSMLASFSLMLLSVFRLTKVNGAPK
jgi:cation transport ATPase